MRGREETGEKKIIIKKIATVNSYIRVHYKWMLKKNLDIAYFYVT